MKITLPTLLLLIVMLLVGWSLAVARQPQPAPIPTPLVNRPVVRWVARTAKSLLWVMAFAEDRPAVVENKRQSAVDTTATLAKANGESDPPRRIDWSEGW